MIDISKKNFIVEEPVDMRINLHEYQAFRCFLQPEDFSLLAAIGVKNNTHLLPHILLQAPNTAFVNWHGQMALFCCILFTTQKETDGICYPPLTTPILPRQPGRLLTALLRKGDFFNRTKETA